MYLWSVRYTAAALAETDCVCRAGTGFLDHSVEAVAPCDDEEVVGSGEMLRLASMDIWRFCPGFRTQRHFSSSGK